MKLTSYWLDTAEPSGDYRRTTLPENVDVAVIGAGFTGLSAALELAKSGASVALLESHTVGWGASGRNGGMATTGLAIGFRTAVKRYGAERAKEMFHSYNHAIDTIEDLIKVHDIDCDYERAGKMSLACRPSHFEGMKATQAALADIAGQKVHIVPKSEIRRELDSDYYHGAMVDPLGAGLHVGKFAHGLAKACKEAGVHIAENAKVVELKRISGTSHDVVTERGTIRAAKVLVGTSGYTGGLTPWLQRRVIPVGSFIVVTEPLDVETAAKLIPNRRMASDSNNLLYYFRLTPDNRMLFGGRARFALSSPDSDLKSGRILQKAMTEVFPRLQGTKIDYTWGGLVDLSMDQMVHAGERNGLYYSVCYSGHGVQMATHMGKQMASVITGDSTANPWQGLSFPPVPGHFGPPWFLPFAGAYFKALDKIK